MLADLMPAASVTDLQLAALRTRFPDWDIRAESSFTETWFEGIRRDSGPGLCAVVAESIAKMSQYLTRADGC